MALAEGLAQGLSSAIPLINQKRQLDQQDKALDAQIKSDDRRYRLDTKRFDEALRAAGVSEGLAAESLTEQKRATGVLESQRGREIATLEERNTLARDTFEAGAPGREAAVRNVDAQTAGLNAGTESTQLDTHIRREADTRARYNRAGNALNDMITAYGGGDFARAMKSREGRTAILSLAQALPDFTQAIRSVSGTSNQDDPDVRFADFGAPDVMAIGVKNDKGGRGFLTAGGDRFAENPNDPVLAFTDEDVLLGMIGTFASRGITPPWVKSAVISMGLNLEDFQGDPVAALASGISDARSATQPPRIESDAARRTQQISSPVNTQIAAARLGPEALGIEDAGTRDQMRQSAMVGLGTGSTAEESTARVADANLARIEGSKAGQLTLEAQGLKNQALELENNATRAGQNLQGARVRAETEELGNRILTKRLSEQMSILGQTAGGGQGNFFQTFLQRPEDMPPGTNGENVTRWRNDVQNFAGRTLFNAIASEPGLVADLGVKLSDGGQINYAEQPDGVQRKLAAILGNTLNASRLTMFQDLKSTDIPGAVHMAVRNLKGARGLNAPVEQTHRPEYGTHTSSGF